MIDYSHDHKFGSWELGSVDFGYETETWYERKCVFCSATETKDRIILKNIREIKK